MVRMLPRGRSHDKKDAKRRANKERKQKVKV
jgi:hypothetical protein